MLLPSIIFQDLVFGADLGSGSFSTVRTRARTRAAHEMHPHSCLALCIRACTRARGHRSPRTAVSGALLQARAAGGACGRVARVRRQGGPG